MSFKTFLSLSLLSALTVGVVSHIASNEGEYEREYYAQLTEEYKQDAAVKAKQPELVTINDPLGIGATDVTLEANCANGTIRYVSGGIAGHLYLNEFLTPNGVEQAYVDHMSDSFLSAETALKIAQFNSNIYKTQLERVCN